MDVINFISKVPGLPDAPIVNPREKYQPAAMYYANGYCITVAMLFCHANKKLSRSPRVHEYLKEMNREVLSSELLSRCDVTLFLNPLFFLEYDRIITVGEAPSTFDMRVLAEYVLPASRELNMVFQFELMEIDSSGKTRENPLQPRKWKLTEFKEIVNRWQTFLRDEGFWNAYVSISQ